MLWVQKVKAVTPTVLKVLGSVQDYSTTTARKITNPI